jgi:hypothetical protein
LGRHPLICFLLLRCIAWVLLDLLDLDLLRMSEIVFSGGISLFYYLIYYSLYSWFFYVEGDINNWIANSRSIFFFKHICLPWHYIANIYLDISQPLFCKQIERKLASFQLKYSLSCHSHKVGPFIIQISLDHSKIYTSRCQTGRSSSRKYNNRTEG